MAKAFIEDPSQLSENYGDLNKVLAAEWAKFRWGVFDDSPPPNAGRDFYATQSFVEASKCSLEIKVGCRVYSKEFFLKDFWKNFLIFFLKPNKGGITTSRRCWVTEKR